MPKNPKKRRLVKGKDWDGWAWKAKNGILSTFMTDTRDWLETMTLKPSADCVPVKVKLVEVKP